MQLGKFDASTHNKKDSEFRVVTLNKFRAVSVTLNPDGSEKLGTYQVGNRHPSVTLGYLGHPRTQKKACGPTSNTDLGFLNRIIPLLEDIGKIYEKNAPVQFKHQMLQLDNHRSLAEKHKLLHFQIGQTPFTSITVNETHKGKPTNIFTQITKM